MNAPLMNALARTPLRVRHEVRRRLLQVVRVEQLTPRMRRIVLGGDALDGFSSAAADDHVKLFFPPPATARRRSRRMARCATTPRAATIRSPAS